MHYTMHAAASSYLDGCELSASRQTAHSCRTAWHPSQTVTVNAGSSPKKRSKLSWSRGSSVETFLHLGQMHVVYFSFVNGCVRVTCPQTGQVPLTWVAAVRVDDWQPRGRATMAVQVATRMPVMNIVLNLIDIANLLKSTGLQRPAAPVPTPA
jgi:hypothetical protein